MTPSLPQPRIGALFLGLLALLTAPAAAQQPLYERTPDWFFDAKFGVFVHFGCPGTFRFFRNLEPRQGEAYPRSAYVAGGRAQTLTADHVRQWVDQIESWGARYAVLTAKHRPGYALWPTAVHDRHTGNLSAGKSDLVAAWTSALQEKGIRTGLYFSHYDQGDPDFLLAKDIASSATPAEKQAAWERYLPKRDQMVEELATRYGQIDLFWWDEDWCAKDYVELGSDRMLDLVFRHQPGAVHNNRARHPWRWHYRTPEKYVPLDENQPIPFELCDNLTESNGWEYRFPYGFMPEEYRAREDVLETFLETISRGGNYLLNIGPRPDGSIPQTELDILDHVGGFVNTYGEAIFGSRRGLPRTHYAGPSTQKGNTVFLFVPRGFWGEITVMGVLNEVESVRLMPTGEPLPYRLTGGRPTHNRPAWIKIPVDPIDLEYPSVVQLTFAGDSLRLTP